MVSIFTRSLTDDLASLVKQIDKKAGKFKGKSSSPLRAFVVYLTDDPDAAEEKLQAFAKKHGIKNVPLTIFDGIAGPPRYKISKDADLTVMMWRRTTVKANHAYGPGQFKAEMVDTVVKDLAKIMK